MWLADPGSPAGRTAGCGVGESGPLSEPGVACGSPAPPPPDQLHFSQLEKDKVRAEKPQVLDRSTWASPRGAPGEARVNQAVALATPTPAPALLGVDHFQSASRPRFLLSVCFCVYSPGQLLWSPAPCPQVKCLFTSVRICLWPGWTGPHPLSSGLWREVCVGNRHINQ